MRITNAIGHPETTSRMGFCQKANPPMCDFYEARLMDLLALAPDEWQHIENQIDASFVFVLSLGLLYELGKEEIALSTADATEDPAPANHEAVLKSHEGGSLRAD